MRVDDEHAVLCRELGRCAGWAWCRDCGECDCRCRCKYSPMWWRDEWGQNVCVLDRVQTLQVRGEFL